MMPHIPSRKLADAMHSLVNVMQMTCHIKVVSWGIGNGFRTNDKLTDSSIPFINFLCDEFSLRIVDQLLIASNHDCKRHFHWNLTAHFLSGPKMQFRLECPELRRIKPVFRYKSLVSDLEDLSDLFKNAAPYFQGDRDLPPLPNRSEPGHEEAWQQVLPDPKITSLVASMNASGLFATRASCEGHWRRYSRPYVFFESTIAIAYRLHHAIRASQAVGEINYRWEVQGSLLLDGRLRFILESEELLEKHDYLFGASIHFGLNRHRIDADIHLLEQLVKDLAKGINSHVNEASAIENELIKTDGRVYLPCKKSCDTKETEKSDKTRLSLLLSSGLFIFTKGIRIPTIAAYVSTCSERLLAGSAQLHNLAHKKFLSFVICRSDNRKADNCGKTFALSAGADKPSDININSPRIVQCADTPEARRFPFASSPPLLISCGHRLTGSHLANPDRRRVVPVRPMEVE